MGIAVLLLAVLALEDPPKDVIFFFRSVAATLADADRDVNVRAELKRPRRATEFLDHFDKSMPGYAEFSGQIEEMVGAGEVAATIDFVNSEGDERKMTMDLDWLLECEEHGKLTQREKSFACRVAKKQWVTSERTTNPCQSSSHRR